MLPAQHAANANAYYQQLRGLLPGGDVITVKDLTLNRDAAVFSFRSGSFAFYGEVNGKITGAVFEGAGHLHITPPSQEERHNLSLQMHTEEFDEDFDQVVLRFTDATAAELRKASAGAGQSESGFTKAAQSAQELERHKLHNNLDLRLLQDVMSPSAGQFFFAAIHGKKNSHLLFAYDPNGVAEYAPEEVALVNWNSLQGEASVPLAFHRAAEYAHGVPNGDEHNASYTITSENLDVTIEKSGFLSSLATVNFRAEQDGVSVIPFDLYSTLRVSQVTNDKNEQLEWVQENKDDDPDFGVVLAKPLKKGETATIKITYGGKEVVINEGSGNYYPVAREDWYPNSGQGFGDYATYHMLFHTPKGLQLIATGTKVNESSNGKITTTEWKTETPLPVVGFSLGDFATKESQINTPLNGKLTIDAYANKDKPDSVSSLAQNLSDNNVSLGSLDTTPMLANELDQGRVAAQIYTQYFGTLPFPHIALTQQSACNYGQSWPMLVYLPICGFFDATQQHFLGLRSEDMYWKMVTPHEVAHQWWGQTVGFHSYRDQWMSEGFADASASIFLQLTRPKPNDFLDFWKQERKMITEKNEFGFRAIDVGPVTMGYRLNSPKAGYDIARNLIYPKGAYILHMIRMMMWTPKEGDARFKETMQDLVKTYQFKAATTEDFKAIVEKHMSPGMDLDGKHNMDWFFNEYVYGTDLPAYHFEGNATPDGEGWKLHFKLTQSNVGKDFANAIPLYLELTDGKIMRLGLISVHGPNTIEQTINLPKLPAGIKKVTVNYYYDVLCTDN
jgi:hypothetical protein